MYVAPALAKSATMRSTGDDHQVHVDRRRDAGLAQRLADQRADGQVRHVMVVHDIEVDPVGAGRQHRVDFFAQAGEVGRQDRGSDDGFMAEQSSIAVPALYYAQRIPRAARIAS